MIFFSRVVAVAEGYGLLSDEHFSVDSTLIEAWASQKSFRPKDEVENQDDEQSSGGRDPEVDFKGELRCNDTHASTTDALSQRKRQRSSALWPMR